MYSKSSTIRFSLNLVYIYASSHQSTDWLVNIALCLSDTKNTKFRLYRRFPYPIKGWFQDPKLDEKDADKEMVKTENS